MEIKSKSNSCCKEECIREDDKSQCKCKCNEQCLPLLRIYIDTTDYEFYQLYSLHIMNHNKHVLNNTFPNSGFDIFIPETITFQGNETKLINLNIITEMYNENKQITAFYVYPRSSISKTPLLLTNNIGIIDQGYRGNIKGAFYSFSNETYVVEKHTRLLQICHPFLLPFLVELVNNKNDFTSSERGIGGFGSTGVVGAI
jgi:dUTP pyrophosphatase